MADLVITAASVKPVTGTTATRMRLETSGEALIAGEAVYKKASDKKIYKADNNVTAAEIACTGICMDSAPGADQPVMIASGGDVDIGATVAIGTVYVVSINAGKIAPLADLLTTNRIFLIGIGITVARIKLIMVNPEVALP